MASVTITSPVEGFDVDDVTSDLPHEAWYLANGYAKLTAPPATDSLRLTTSTDADEDPTLAINREKPNRLDNAEQGETPGVDYKSVDATDSAPNSASASQDRGPTASGFNAPADDLDTDV